MKRILSFVMVCVSVLCLASCSWNVEPPSVTDAVTSASAENFFASIDKTIDYRCSSDRIMPQQILTAPGMLMFKCNKREWMICHNPQTGESRMFCSNPACTHSDKNCVMVHFRTSHAITYYDGYLYIMYLYPDPKQDKYSGLIRMSLDGTNIEYLYHMNPTKVNLIKGYDGYVYINDVFAGLYRYCIETGEMEHFDDGKSLYNGFMITDYGIILHCRSDETVYLADYDLKEKKELFPMGALVYKDDKIYRVKIHKKAGETTTEKIEFYEYDIKTGTDRYICEDKGTGGFFCVADGYMYYSPEANVKIGNYLNGTGGVVYQVDIITGDKKTVFNDPALNIQSMYCINGKMYGEIYSRNTYKCDLPTSLSTKTVIFGEFVDRDNDGTWEFEPFVWDTSMFEF